MYTIFPVHHNDIQHNDTQHDDIQHKDTQHNDIYHSDNLFQIFILFCKLDHFINVHYFSSAS